MGVPLLLTWLRTNFKKCFSNRFRGAVSTSKLHSVTHLYIDLNSLLHQAAEIVVAQISNEKRSSDGPEISIDSKKIEDDVLRALVRLLDQLLWMASEAEDSQLELVFIAVDGVPPLGKVAQQRTRRQGSRRAREELWDTNNITPGTHFMSVRVTALLKWYAASRTVRNSKKHPLAILVSDATVPGEGEQKIVDFVRTYRQGLVLGEPQALKTFEHVTHILCSNDSDTIIAALTLHTPNTFVLRYQPEAIGSTASSSLDTASRSMQYFSIELFRQQLFELFQRPDLEAFEFALHDFTFILLLFGSDFLPGVPWLDIGDGKLDLLLEIYADHILVQRKHLVDPTRQGRLDGSMLPYYLSLVAKALNASKPTEDEQLSKEPGIGMKRPREGGLQIYFGGSAGASPFGGGTGAAPAPTTTNQSQTIFAENAATSAPGEKQPTALEVIDSFWEGVQWMLFYQGGQCQNWRWCYPSVSSPTLEELSTRCLVSKVAFREVPPLHPLELLLLVLPERSKELLPRAVSNGYDEAFAPLLRDSFHRLNLNSIRAKVDLFLPLLSAAEQQRALLRTIPPVFYLCCLSNFATWQLPEAQSATELTSKVTPAPQSATTTTSARVVKVTAVGGGSGVVGGLGLDDDDDPLPGLDSDCESEDDGEGERNGAVPVVEVPPPVQSTPNVVHQTSESSRSIFGVSFQFAQRVLSYQCEDSTQRAFAVDVQVHASAADGSLLELQFWNGPITGSPSATSGPSAKQHLIPLNQRIDLTPPTQEDERQPTDAGRKEAKLQPLPARARADEHRGQGQALQSQVASVYKR